MSIGGSVAVTHCVGACRACWFCPILRIRVSTQQTAYPGLPDPNALQEKFYWCTVTLIMIETPARHGLLVLSLRFLGGSGRDGDGPRPN